MIEILNVSKSYARGAKKAVDSLNMTVGNGEIFGFIGPNGAGKTATIKMITGILEPDEGSIKVNGRDIQHEDVEAKLSIGYVPDVNEIYEAVTGYEYLNFLADIYRVDSTIRAKRIKKYLEMFELESAAGDLIKTYSHGMKQKIIITGALLHDPALWILDEPLTGLDPKSAFLLKEEMRSHCAAGKTVFFSTHVLEVAEKLCNRIAIIDNGKIAAVGTLEELEKSSGNSLESIFLKLTEKDGGLNG
jgi:ABC-2 type transport system ATP-binding protein